MTSVNASLVDKCLIATPVVKDPIFESSLVYMCEHNEAGSMGLVVNHKTDQQLKDVFSQLDIDCKLPEIAEQPIYIGGPVHLEQGFVLHSTERQWKDSLQISDDILLTSSVDILQDIARGNGPLDYLVMLGFAGWSSGQLESELHQNAWLTAACSNNLLFREKAEDKWQLAFDSLGFDLSKLSPVSGNA